MLETFSFAGIQDNPSSFVFSLNWRRGYLAGMFASENPHFHQKFNSGIKVNEFSDNPR